MQSLHVHPCDQLKQGFLSRGDFAPPPGHIRQCLETFFIVTTAEGKGCSLHLVGRGQGGCSTSWNTQPCSIPEKVTWFQMSTVPGWSDPELKEDRSTTGRRKQRGFWEVTGSLSQLYSLCPNPCNVFVGCGNITSGIPDHTTAEFCLSSLVHIFSPCSWR